MSAEPQGAGANAGSAGPSVFLSYAKADAERAEEICRHLESRGVRCWIAPRDVRSGRDFAAEIIHGIERSRALVLVLSEHANRSKFVKAEVERAYSKGKPVFPVRIEDVLPSTNLELFISGSQWVDAWFGRMADHIDRLARDIEGGNRDDGARPAGSAPGRRSGAPPARLRPRTAWRAAALLAGVGAVAAGFVLYQRATDTPAPDDHPTVPPVASSAPPVSAPAPTPAPAPAPTQGVAATAPASVPAAAPADAALLAASTNCRTSVNDFDFRSDCSIVSRRMPELPELIEAIFAGADPATLEQVYSRKLSAADRAAASGAQPAPLGFVVPLTTQAPYLQVAFGDGSRSEVFRPERVEAAIEGRIAPAELAEGDAQAAPRVYVRYNAPAYPDGPWEWQIGIPAAHSGIPGMWRNTDPRRFEYDLDGKGFLKSRAGDNFVVARTPSPDDHVRFRFGTDYTFAGTYKYVVDFFHIALDSMLAAAHDADWFECRVTYKYCEVVPRGLAPVVAKLSLGWSADDLVQRDFGVFPPESVTDPRWFEFLTCYQDFQRSKWLYVETNPEKKKLLDAEYQCAFPDAIAGKEEFFLPIPGDATDLYYSVELVDGTTTALQRLRLDDSL